MGNKSAIDYLIELKKISELSKIRRATEREVESRERERINNKIDKRIERSDRIRRKVESIKWEMRMNKLHEKIEKRKLEKQIEENRKSLASGNSNSIDISQHQRVKQKFNQLKIGNHIKLIPDAEVFALDDRDGHELEKRTIKDGIWEVELILNDDWIAISLNSESIPDKDTVPKSHRSRIQRKYIKEVLKNASWNKRFNQLQEGDFIALKSKAELVPIGEVPLVASQKIIENGEWQVEQILEQDMIQIALNNGLYRCHTHRRWIKTVLP